MAVKDQSMDADASDLLRVRSAWKDYFNEGDVDSICASCSPDLVAIPPEREAFTGLPALKALYEEFFASVSNARMGQDPVVRLEIVGDRAFTVGSYTYEYEHDGVEVELYGRSTEIWSREDGEWKLMIDMWNVLPETVDRKGGAL